MATATPEARREVYFDWRGPIEGFIRDDARLVDLEGAFRSGKTTAALAKVAAACLQHPGMHWLVCRYGDQDTQSKLRPPWRQTLHTMGVRFIWNPNEQYDQLANGSRVYLFGLKAADQVMRYAKLRGLTLAGIYVDQAEELPYDVFLELAGRLSQSGYPHQILLTPNPPSEAHWLAQEFPEGNPDPRKRYYHLSIYDNAHNLPPETIADLEATYPPGHPKRRTAIEGLRGLNVIGTPVYKGLFTRALHVRPCVYNPALPLYEGIDFGRHHPCLVWAQYPPLGGVVYLGGILGQDLFLEDFLPLVQQTRAQWFPQIASLQTCCDPAGAQAPSGTRLTGVQILKEAGFAPVWRTTANSPEVRLAMIERLGAHMRRRTPVGEALLVERDPTRWLRVTGKGETQPWTFVADAFEAGYVWSEHLVSVGRKQVRTPKKDGWYDHGMNCAEYLELSFGAQQLTEAEKAAEARRELARQADRVAARSRGPSGADAWLG
jgi:hypothetical protein